MSNRLPQNLRTFFEIYRSATGLKTLHASPGHVSGWHNTMGCQVGKKHLLFTYILSNGCYFLSQRYNLVCVAHYFLSYRYAYYFFCNIQNPFCHAFNLLCHGYNLFCYSNYSLFDIHYFQCCALNFLSVVHYSASTQYNFRVIFSPLKFPVSQHRYSVSCTQNFL